MIFQVHLFLRLNQKVVNGLISMKFGIMPIHGGSGELKGVDFSKVGPIVQNKKDWRAESGLTCENSVVKSHWWSLGQCRPGELHLYGAHSCNNPLGNGIEWKM